MPRTSKTSVDCSVDGCGRSPGQISHQRNGTLHRALVVLLGSCDVCVGRQFLFFLRGKAVESKKAEMQAAMKDAVALLHEYAPLDPAKIQAAKDAGNLSVSSPAPDGTVSVTIKNYLKAGDQVAITLDGAKNALKGFSISSYVGDAAAKEKSPVAAQVTFGMLPDGTVYTAKETLDLSAQSLKVATENTGYKKQG